MKVPRCLERFRLRRRRASKPSAAQASAKLLSITSPLDPDALVEWCSDEGRKDGEHNIPPVTELGLGPVEADVESRYHSVHQKRLQDYREKEGFYKDRMREPPEDDTDGIAENNCQHMQSTVLGKTEELAAVRKEVENAHTELSEVMSKYNLDRTAKARAPDSWPKFLGILAVVLVVETVVNGVFFGTNLAGALVGGMTYAVIISVVNVVAFGSMAGFLAAWSLRHADSADSVRQLFAMAGLALVLIMGVLLNLGVAHYREALPGDYPPAPVGNTTTLATPTPVVALNDDVAACRMGDDETVAGREAICLFWSEWLELSDFESYILMLIGLTAFGFAAWKWSGRLERWPGYGDAVNRQKKAEGERKRVVDKLVNDLERIRANAVDSQEDLVRNADPVSHWKTANDAYDKVCALREQFCENAEFLQKCCRRAIASYRSTNRYYREEPEPNSWQVEWTPNWKLPEVPARPDIGSLADARHRRDEARSAKEERIKKLRDCHKRCVNDVRKHARPSKPKKPGR